MYNDNNRKLRTVLLVLAIVLVLLRIVKTAKAEGMDSYYLDTLRPMFPDFTDEQWDIVESASETCPYFIKLDSTNSAYRILILYPYSSQYVYDHSTGVGNSVPCYCVGGSSSGIGVGGFVLSPYSLGNVSGNAAYAHYAFVDYLSSHEAHGIKYIPNRQTYDSSSSFNMRWFSCSGSAIVGGSVPSQSWAYSRDSYLTNDNCVFETNYTVFTKFEKNIEKPTYVDDDRLKFWTYDNLDGTKTLVTSFDAFCEDSIFVQNEFTDIVLTYVLDNVENTVSLDASNSVIRSTQNQNGGNITYKLETPFSVFGFDDSIVSFKITKCDFTYVKTTMGNVDTTDFKISCDFLVYSRFVPVEPAVIPSPAVSDPAVDSSVYTFINTVYGSYSSDRYGRFGTWDVASSEPSDVSIFRAVDVYHFANEEHGSGVDESIYYYSLTDWSNTPLDLNAYNVFNWDKFLSENTSALYFDVISVPIYHFTPVGQSSSITGCIFDGYALFYTPSYFLRQQYGLLGDILTVVDQDAQNQYNNGIWLVDKINDFEDKTLDVFNASLDIDTDSLSWLKTIDNSIKSLDFPIFDDSSILSGLASIVTALSGDNDDLGVNGRLDKLINFFVANEAERNDSALTYRNWLDGLDPTETRRVTHFGSNIYSLVKNIFDIFDADYTEDPSFENPDKDYLDIASDYIDALNDRNNTNKFFRGFFDSSFDPLVQSGLPEE